MAEKIVAFVPIKLNSQRLPHKNILPLGDKPLCYHIFETLLKIKQIDDVYVFCSDEKIKNYIPQGVKFLKRPKSLDTNETIGMDIYQSFKNMINANIYVLCHATSPFIKAQTISQGIDAIINDNYDSAFSCEKIQTFCWYKNSPINYTLDYIPRTQDIEPIYVETSSFYIFTKDVIDNKRRIGKNCKKIVIDKIEGIDIDYKEDYEFALKCYNAN